MTTAALRLHRPLLRGGAGGTGFRGGARPGPLPAVSGLNLAQQDLVIPLTDMDPYSRPWQFQSQMTEGYSVNGTASTPEQAFFELKSLLQNKAISGTTLTSYQINGSTTAPTACEAKITFAMGIPEARLFFDPQKMIVI